MDIQNKIPVSLGLMRSIAKEAGVIIRDVFHTDMDIETKDDTTPVTEADKAVNRLVIERVRAVSPDVDIIGEEESSRTDSLWQIMCDPIDGTYPFTWGIPVSTFMLGLKYGHKLVSGVIYDPFTDRMYSAQVGQGAHLNNKRIRVSSVSGKEGDRRLVVGMATWPGCSYNLQTVQRELETVHGIETIDLASIGYLEALVASGKIDACIFPGVKHHDTAPGHPIVEEAGGRITDIFGEPLRYENGEIRGHVCSNGTELHELLVSVIKKHN